MFDVREWVSLLKVGFKSKFSIAGAVVILAMLYPMFSQPFVRLTILIAFLPIGELFVFTNITPVVMRSLSLVFTRRNINWQQTPDWLTKLAEEMKVKIKKFGMKEGLDNAYSLVDGTVVFGKKLFDRLPNDALIGVGGHELGHIKGRHGLKMMLYMFIVINLAMLSFAKLPSAMACLATFAYFSIMMTLFSWRHELQADAIAAKTNSVGAERMKSALLALADGKNTNEHSETHPSIAMRIKRLERLSSRLKIKDNLELCEIRV